VFRVVPYEEGVFEVDVVLIDQRDTSLTTQYSFQVEVVFEAPDDPYARL